MGASVDSTMDADSDPEVSAVELAALWADLAPGAETGTLSEGAFGHLLALADELSAQGNWPHAWRALAIAQQGADRANRAHYRVEISIHCGIVHQLAI